MLRARLLLQSMEGFLAVNPRDSAALQLIESAIQQIADFGNFLDGLTHYRVRQRLFSIPILSSRLA